MALASSRQAPATNPTTDEIGRRFGGFTTRLFVLLLFLILALAMTWPLALNLSTAVPGPPWDNFVWLYDLWYLRHSVVELGELPSINTTIFYPSGYDLSLSETMIANKVLIAPFLFWGNEVLAYNMLLLLSFVLTGYTTYLLVAYLTDNTYAGVVAGAIFAFCPYRFHAMAAGWLPLISTQWMPLVFLYLERTLREGKPRFAWLAGLFIALTALSSWYYVYILGSMLLVYLAFRLWPWGQTLRDRRVIGNLLWVAAVVLLLTLPVAWPMIRNNAGEMGWSLAEVEKWEASIDDFVLPNVYSPIWGAHVLSQRAETLRYPWYAPGFVYLGLVSIILAMVGLGRGRNHRALKRPFAWMGFVAFVLALGVVLRFGGEVVQIAVPERVGQIYVRVLSTVMSKLALNKASLYEIPFDAGHVPVPLPAMLVYLFVPFGNAMRTLYRFGVMTMLAVAVLAGIGSAHLLGGMMPPGAESKTDVRQNLDDKRGRPVGVTPLVVCTLLMALVLADFLSAPLAYGFSDVRPQAIDRWLAAHADEGAVMQFPLVRALSGDALYRTKYHGKPVTYGHGTFYPESYRYNMPLLADFPSEATLQLLKSWGVRYVVVGSGAYDAGWGDQEGQTWASVESGIQASGRLVPIGVALDEPIWRDEWVSDIIVGSLPVQPILVDKLYVYELR